MKRLIMLATSLCLMAAAARGTADGFALRFSGILGQSQPAGVEPLKDAGFTGCFFDNSGFLWAASGRNLLRFENNLLVNTIACPHAVNQLRWDGERAYFIADGALSAFNPSDMSFGKVADLPPQIESFCVEKTKFALLRRDGQVLGMSKDGAPLGELLRAPPLEDGCFYNNICFDSSDGGLLVGSYYPDNKIRRFKPDGAMDVKGGWPIPVFAAGLFTLGRENWVAANGGRIFQPRDKGKSDFQIPWCDHLSGLAKAPSGNFMLACSQGLVEIAPDGTPLGRLGGIPETKCMATSHDGYLLAAIDQGQRLLRLKIDAGPDSFLQSDDGYWRIGGNYKSKAAALAWDDAQYLALDSVEGCLWGFDFAKRQFNHNPWNRLTPTASFSKPMAMAFSDGLALIVDNKGLSSVDLNKGAELKFLASKFDATAIALSATGVLVAASPRGLSGYKLDAGLTKLWDQPLKPAYLATCGSGLVAASFPENGELSLLDPKNGEPLARLTAASVPGGMKPAAICAAGPWLFVYDAKGFRVIRLKIIPPEAKK